MATRTDAARLFFAAVARLAEAKAAWERVLREAQRAQAQAVQDLLGSGLQPDEVAELLGISNGELRSLGGATPARPRAPVRERLPPWWLGSSNLGRNAEDGKGERLAAQNQRPATELPAELRKVPVPERGREWIHRYTGSRVLVGVPTARCVEHGRSRRPAGERLRAVAAPYVWEKFRIVEPGGALEVEALEYARLNGLLMPGVIAADPGWRRSVTGSRPF